MPMVTSQILKCADLAKTQKYRYLIKAILFFFHVGAENDKVFTYIGINIKQKSDMSINTHLQSLKTIPLNKDQFSDLHLSTTPALK